MGTKPPRKNLNWMYGIFLITGLLLVSISILLKDPNLEWVVGPFVVTRQGLLIMIGLLGIMIAVMGGMAYLWSDTDRKRKTAMGIVIIGSAVAIISLLLKP